MKRYKIICPLLNFSVPNMIARRPELSEEETTELLKKQEERLTRGIPLVEGIRIRRVSKEDIEDLSDPILSSLHAFGKFHANMFVLVRHIQKKQDSKTHQTMQNAVLALRLLKKGYVSGNYTFYVLIAEKTRRLSSWVMEEAPRLYGVSGGRAYVLQIQEIPALRKILKKIQAVDFIERPSFYLAVKRFQRGYEETDEEYKLVDFIIALEALFLRGEKGGPSSGKIISVACSTLLGKNQEEREVIRRTLTEAYRIRNCIVHGSEYERIKPNSKGEHYFDTLPDLVSEVEDYLRESIKRLLNLEPKCPSSE